MAEHSIDFWLQSEDLPRPENRIRYDGDRVVLDVTQNNQEAPKRLKAKLEGLLGRSAPGRTSSSGDFTSARTSPSAAPRIRPAPVASGPTPRPLCWTSTARAHELDNLYITDASFFPSIGAVNPTLTIIANALRVADRIAERLGA